MNIIENYEEYVNNIKKIHSNYNWEIVVKNLSNIYKG